MKNGQYDAVAGISGCGLGHGIHPFREELLRGGNLCVIINKVYIRIYIKQKLLIAKGLLPFIV
jgi:hypothetical protein